MSKVILVGAGPMSVQYVSVLDALSIDYKVIGRGEVSAANFTDKTGKSVSTGGLDAYLTNNPIPEQAIVSTSVESLFENCQSLLKAGCKHILVEKPAGVDLNQIETLAKSANQYNAKVYVAYNRRFYQSVAKAKEIIAEDGGITSFLFEFTEVSFRIKDIPKGPGVKENWFLANSTHVADLAFFIGGQPAELTSLVSGKLDWHSRSAQFVGAGKTKDGVLFSYHANWDGPGRWSAEFVTPKNRLILAPMEQLKVQRLGSFDIETVELDSDIDTKHKAGLYLQTKNFLENIIDDRFCTIAELQSELWAYKLIAAY